MPRPTLTRRDWLQTTAVTAVAGWTLGEWNEVSAAKNRPLTIAPFRFDLTPPIGHSCCGGWIKPVEVVDDELEAIGFVLSGLDKPIVLCAVDWTGLLNNAHVQWRTALAEAAGTTPDCVAVQCVHQHNAPFACLDAQQIVAAQGDLPDIVDVDFFNECLERGRTAVREALNSARPCTHIAHSEAPVEKVASNRRVSRDESGRIKAMRGSSCRNPDLIAMPEGLIDPQLKTVAFYDGEEKVVSCHYYATHPMSYYADGRVSSDFAGLARKQRQSDEPDCLHVYFTGCSGNIAAGKYNDGSHEARVRLTERVYDGIVRSEAGLKAIPIDTVRWSTSELLPPARASFDATAIEQQIANRDNRVVARNRPAYTLAWLRRVEAGMPILLSGLHINDTSLLHLPAECFIEYQLRAQKIDPGRFTAVAAYGDGGPWYIPVAKEYPNGGYEVSVAFCEPEVDDLLSQGMRRLLS